MSTSTRSEDKAVSDFAFMLSQKADSSNLFEDHEEASLAHQKAIRFFEEQGNKSRVKKHNDAAWHHIHFLNREKPSDQSIRRNSNSDYRRSGFDD